MTPTADRRRERAFLARILGDVVYERGMPEPISTVEKPLDAAADVMDVVLPDLLASRQEAERQMRAQLAVVAETKARAVFVAGNHDWDQFEVGGWERILALEQFIRNEAAAQGANVALTPSGGCPGPVAVPAGRRATVVAIDTQWWIETRKDGKPTPDRNPTNCLWVTEDAVQAQLVKELAKAKREDRWAIVAAHHPLETKGPHGGFVDVRTHLFPLRIIRHYLPFYLEWIPIPIFGSAVVWYRQCCSPSVQDMGSRASSVGSNARTIFAHSNPLQSGFMEIDFLTDGSARLAVWETDAERPDGVEVFSMLLAKRKP